MGSRKHARLIQPAFCQVAASPVVVISRNVPLGAGYISPDVGAFAACVRLLLPLAPLPAVPSLGGRRRRSRRRSCPSTHRCRRLRAEPTLGLPQVACGAAAAAVASAAAFARICRQLLRVSPAAVRRTPSFRLQQPPQRRDSCGGLYKQSCRTLWTRSASAHECSGLLQRTCSIKRSGSTWLLRYGQNCHSERAADFTAGSSTREL